MAKRSRARRWWRRLVIVRVWRPWLHGDGTNGGGPAAEATPFTRGRQPAGQRAAVVPAGTPHLTCAGRRTGGAVSRGPWPHERQAP